MAPSRGLSLESPAAEGFVVDHHLGHNSRRDRRAEVAVETLKMLEQQPTEVCSKRIDVWDSSSSDPFDSIQGVVRPHSYTEVQVEVSDVLDSAARLADASGPLPLVLNMANPVVAGGGFLNGAGAQEEELCRRTNLYPTLQQAQYPLPEFGVLWSSPVDVIRQGADRDYTPTRSTFQIAVASAAAYQQPPVDWKLEKLQEPVRSRMGRKIRALLAAAAMQGHSTLVLSAWGCGAFMNPSRDIAELFREALHDPRLRGIFRIVSFAILDREPGGVGENVKAFQSVFGARSSILGVSAQIPESLKLSGTTEEKQAGNVKAVEHDDSVLAEAARVRQHLKNSGAGRRDQRSSSIQARALPAGGQRISLQANLAKVASNTPRGLHRMVGCRPSKPSRPSSEGPWQRRVG